MDTELTWVGAPYIRNDLPHRARVEEKTVPAPDDPTQKLTLVRIELPGRLESVMRSGKRVRTDAVTLVVSNATILRIVPDPNPSPSKPGAVLRGIPGNAVRVILLQGAER